MTRKTKIVIGIIALILAVLLTGGFFVYWQFFAKESQETATETTTYPEIKKEFPAQGLEGISYPYYWYSGCYEQEYTDELNQKIIGKAKEIGANYLYVRATYNGTEDGQLDANEEDMRNGIQKFVGLAHQNGIGIFLTPYVESIDYWVKPRWTLEKNIWTKAVLRWAKFAEENQIEIFAPGTEMNIILKENEVGPWFEEILPKIKKVYHGKVTTDECFDIDRWKIIDNAGSFKGYDYLGMTVFPRKQYGKESDIRNYNDYREYVENQAKTMTELADKYNIKGLLACPIGMDFWKGTDLVAQEGSKINPKVQAKAYGIALDIFKKYDFDVVIIHEDIYTNQGKPGDKEILEMLRERWIKHDQKE